MSVFVASIIILSIGSGYALILKRTLFETIFLSIATVVFVIYCFGLLNFKGCLLYGIYLLIILAILSVAYVLYVFFVQKLNERIRSCMLAQGTLIFILLLLLSLYINYGRYIARWDEFSRWARMVKHLFAYDALSTYNSFGLSYPDYTQGTTILHYFFSRFSSEFHEYHTLISMNFLYFSMFMPFIKNVFTPKAFHKSVLLLFLFLITPLSQYQFYSTLYVDVMSGFLFGFAFLYYFVYNYEQSIYGTLMLTAAVFLLVLTKQMAIIQVLGLLLVIVIDTVLFRQNQIKTYFNKDSRASKKIIKMISLAMPFIACGFAKFSWDQLVAKNLHGFSWHTPSITMVYLLLTKQVPAEQKQIARDFISSMIYTTFPESPRYLGMSIVTVSILFFVLFFLLSLFKRKRITGIRAFILGFLIAAGSAAYQFVLLLTYVFMQSEHAATNLQSHDRFTTSYLYGMLIVLFYFFLYDNSGDVSIKAYIIHIKTIVSSIRLKFSSDNAILYSDIKSALLFIGKGIYSLIGVSLCLLIIIASSRNILTNVLFTRILEHVHFVPRVTSSINKWKPYFNEANPYVIVQGDDGGVTNRLIYELYPEEYIANLGYDYSIGMEEHTYNYETQDYYTYIVTPEDWQEHILSNNISLIYIFRSDEQLEKYYGHFFKEGIERDMLYRVESDGTNMNIIPVVSD